MAGGRCSRESARLVDTVAFRRMTDQVRSEIARRQRENVAARDVETVAAGEIDCDTDMDPDDTLILLFLCCHPALTSSSSIALTLRAVGGLTTAEIASAFLVPEATMAQRISRAKQSIKASGLPFRSLSWQGRAERLPAVLHALYLIFNEGYASSSGAHLQRLDLAREAIRLTRCAKALLPDDAEVAGLLALMLLTDARRAARTGPDEELIPLDKTGPNSVGPGRDRRRNRAFDRGAIERIGGPVPATSGGGRDS